MSMYTHVCIKPACATSYQSEDPEAYYCEGCKEANKILAQKIDAQIASRPKRPHVSAIQQYEAELKNSGLRANGVPGVKVSI